jgi:polyisoprenoid-binding protein YceI
MKKTNYLLVLMLTTISFGLVAQVQKVNTEKSTVHWLGKKIGGQHEGYIKVKNGSIELKNNNIDAGEFTIDMNSISCSDLEDAGYNKKLIGHLKSDDFFGVAKFSTAKLKFLSASKFSNNKSSIKAELTIKGKTENITFYVTKNKNLYTAKIDVDRSKFDIKYGSTSFFESLGDKAIDDIFILDIKLVVN